MGGIHLSARRCWKALNTGNIDYGAVGDSPPVFAQAARANLLYVASLPGRGDTQAIVVPKDSAIRSLEDLKGKKVAIAKASSAHSLAIAALESAGLKFADIQPQYLPPADAAAAFLRGSVDAWSIWDPFYALAEIKQGARALAIRPEVAAQNSFFLANREFTNKHPGIVSAINDELSRATAWARSNREQAAELFSQASGVELAAQQRTVSVRNSCSRRSLRPSRPSSRLWPTASTSSGSSPRPSISATSSGSGSPRRNAHPPVLEGIFP